MKGQERRKPARRPISRLIYIGSFGNPQRSFKIPAGRLEIICTYNPLLWVKGLCRPPAEKISFNKQIVFTASGPIASLMVVVASGYILSSFEFHRPAKVCQDKLGMLEEGLADIKQALKLDDKSAPAYRNWGHITWKGMSWMKPSEHLKWQKTSKAIYL
jgi:hypothetical protein